MVDAPHFRHPFQLSGSGSFAVLEQDDAAEVAQCVAICLATPVGSRAEVPEYGSPRLEFDLPPPAELVAAVEEWEPRASLDITVAERLSGEESVAHLTVLVANATGEDDT